MTARGGDDESERPVSKASVGLPFVCGFGRWECDEKKEKKERL